MMGKIRYFFVLLTLTISNQAEIKGNVENLFDSIVKNDSRKTETQRIILGEETMREQQAFDRMKVELQRAGRRNDVYINSGKNGNTTAVFKRDTESINGAMSSERDTIRELLRSLGIEKHWVDLNQVEQTLAFVRVAEKYAQLQTSCGEDVGKHDAVNYCNKYRRQVERFEMLFKRFIADAPSFNTTLNVMVPLFQADREATSGQKRMNFYEDLNRQNWFHRFSHTEKWQVILTWFSVLMSDSGGCMPAALEEQDPLLEVLRNSLEDLKAEVEKDFQTIIKGRLSYGAAEYLPFHFKEEKFNILSELQSMDCSQFYGEIKTIGRGFHDGFQRCSLHVKKIEALKSPPDQLFTIRARISNLPPHTETADYLVINKCFSLMVGIGDHLQKI